MKDVIHFPIIYLWLFGYLYRYPFILHSFILHLILTLCIFTLLILTVINLILTGFSIHLFYGAVDVSFALVDATTAITINILSDGECVRYAYFALVPTLLVLVWEECIRVSEHRVNGMD